MFSFPKPNRLLAGRLHLPSLLLPLLALNVTFTNKPFFPDVVLHQLFSSVLILCALVVFYRSCGSKLLAVCVTASLVSLRILRLAAGDAGGLVEAAYLVPYSILFLGVGARMVRDFPLLMLRQITWITGICVCLFLMQLLGVEWAQSLTNFYWETGGEADDCLFVSWKDLQQISAIQTRPVGFTASNNIVSQYLLFFYAFALIWYISDQDGFRPPKSWLFIISFACAVSGAKVVLATVLIINIAAFVIAGVTNLRLFLYAFLVTASAYALYWLFFPGVFVSNFNIDLFAFNAMVRVGFLLLDWDIPYVEEIMDFLSLFQTGDYIGHQRTVTDTVEEFAAHDTKMTGIGTIIGYLPFIIAVLLVLAPFYLHRLRKTPRGTIVDMHKLPILMFLAAVASTAGSPFIATPYFWFFFSIGLFPLSVSLIKPPGNLFDKSVDNLLIQRLSIEKSFPAVQTMRSS